MKMAGNPSHFCLGGVDFMGKKGRVGEIGLFPKILLMRISLLDSYKRGFTGVKESKRLDARPSPTNAVFCRHSRPITL